MDIVLLAELSDAGAFVEFPDHPCVPPAWHNKVVSATALFHLFQDRAPDFDAMAATYKGSVTSSVRLPASLRQQVFPVATWEGLAYGFDEERFHFEEPERLPYASVAVAR